MTDNEHKDREFILNKEIYTDKSVFFDNDFTSLFNENPEDSLIVFKLEGKIVHIRYIMNNFNWKTVYFTEEFMVDEIVFPPYKCIDSVNLINLETRTEIIKTINQ